jgi:hypothetical protein
MRKLLLCLFLFPIAALAQTAARFDLPILTTISSATPSAANLPPLYAITNAQVAICGYPATLSAGMCTNLVTTYTDSTLTGPCPTSAQLTPSGTKTCVSTTGLQGQFGFWYNATANPHLTYTIRVPWGVFGPFDVLQPVGAGGGGGAPNPPSQSIQLANSTINGFTSDPTITVNPVDHTMNVGSIGFAPDGMIEPRNASFGAKGNFVTLAQTAAINSGTSALTLSSGILTAANVGMTVVIPGAGSSATVPLITTITVVNTSTTATLNATAGTTVTTAAIGMGTDDTAALQAAINAAIIQHRAMKLPTPIIPGGSYLVTQSLNATNAQNFYIIGDNPITGFNHSTITHALTETFPVLDLSGSTRSGMINVGIIPALNNVANSQANAGVFIYPGVATNSNTGLGPQSPLYFQLIGDQITAGNAVGGVACYIRGIDVPTLDNTTCTGPIGALVGNGAGTATAVSKFTTPGTGFGDTLCRIDNANIGGTLDTALELTGCQTDQIGGNTFVAALNPGGANRAIISVQASAGFEENFIVANNLRTENQCSVSVLNCPTPTTSMYFYANASKGGIIKGTLNGHAASAVVTDYVFGGPGVLSNYDININWNQKTLFGTTYLGSTNQLAGMAFTTFKSRAAAGPPTQNFGTISSAPFGWFGNTISSDFTPAQVQAGIPAVFGMSEFCQLAGDCEFYGSSPAVFNSTLSTTSDLNVSGNGAIGGSLSVGKTIAIGPMTNRVRNSFNFAAGTWTNGGSMTITGGPACTGGCIADGFGGQTATKIVATAATSLADVNTGITPTGAYINCVHAWGNAGGETITSAAQNFSDRLFTLTTTPIWYCTQSSRNIFPDNAVLLTIPSAETIFLDAELTVSNGAFTGSGDGVYTGTLPSYLPTTGTVVTTPVFDIAIGNSLVPLTGVAVRAGTVTITNPATTAAIIFSTAMIATPTSCSLTPSASAAVAGIPFATALSTTGFTANVPVTPTASLAMTYQCVINNAN